MSASAKAHAATTREVTARSWAPAALACMGVVFGDIGRPADLAGGGAPTPDDLQRLFEVSRAYGYWRGSPADNAAVGISLG